MLKYVSLNAIHTFINVLVAVDFSGAHLDNDSACIALLLSFVY